MKKLLIIAICAVFVISLTAVAFAQQNQGESDSPENITCGLTDIAVGSVTAVFHNDEDGDGVPDEGAGGWIKTEDGTTYIIPAGVAPADDFLDMDSDNGAKITGCSTQKGNTITFVSISEFNVEGGIFGPTTTIEGATTAGPAGPSPAGPRGPATL